MSGVKFLEPVQLAQKPYLNTVFSGSGFDYSYYLLSCDYFVGVYDRECEKRIMQLCLAATTTVSYVSLLCIFTSRR